MAEANANVEGRVGQLERWQGVVDYRLEQGEKQFKDINDKLVTQSERQNQMEIHILSGNRDTADLKRSWEQWLKDWRTGRANRPTWWQVSLMAVSVVVSIGSLIVAIVLASHGGGKP